MHNFFPFDMNSADETTMDWKSQVMKFRIGNSSVRLVGDSALSKTLITLKAMLKTIES